MDKEMTLKMSLQTQIEHYRNVVIVRLNGELDHHSANAVREKIEESLLNRNVHHLVFNLEHLNFMDSSGIGVILGRYKQVKSKGGKVMFCNINPSVSRLLELSGLFKIIETRDSETSAISSLEVVS